MDAGETHIRCWLSQGTKMKMTPLGRRALRRPGAASPSPAAAPLAAAAAPAAASQQPGPCCCLCEVVYRKTSCIHGLGPASFGRHPPRRWWPRCTCLAEGLAPSRLFASTARRSSIADAHLDLVIIVCTVETICGLMLARSSSLGQLLALRRQVLLPAARAGATNSTDA